MGATVLCGAAVGKRTHCKARGGEGVRCRNAYVREGTDLERGQAVGSGELAHAAALAHERQQQLDHCDDYDHSNDVDDDTVAHHLL